MAYADLDTQSTSRGRRPTLVVLALFGIIIVAAVSRWLNGGQGGTGGGQALRLAMLSGSATVARADGSALEVLPGNVPVLGVGDELSTGAGAQARLSLGRAGSVEVGEFARLWILDLRPASLTRGEAVDLALLRGVVEVTVEEASFAVPQVTIETNVATVEARGGARFTLHAAAADHVRVEVYRGGLTVAMGEQSVRLVAGQHLDARLGQPLEPQGTPLPDDGPGELLATDAPGWDYWDESNQTLFPPIVTPTRPGDPVAGDGASPTDEALPLGEVYVVQPGDTLYGIARRYALSWEELWEANKAQLAAPELLRAGQQLRIPR